MVVPRLHAIRLALVLLLFSGVASAGWILAGPPLGVGKNVTLPSVMIFGGVPYVAYANTDENKVYVRRLNAGVWEQVGSAAVNDFLAGSPGPQIFAYGGQPCVLYPETQSSSQYLRSRCWNGSSWVTALGGDILPGNNVFTFSVSGSNVLLTYGSNPVHYQLWNGSAWQSWSTSNDSLLGWPLQVGAASYFSWRSPQFGPDNALHVSSWNGSSWVELPSPGLGGQARMEDVNGTFHLLACRISGHPYVKTWNGTTWSGLGPDQNVVCPLNFTTDGASPYFAHEVDLAGVKVRWYSGPNWEDLQGRIAYGAIGRRALAFDGATPYLVWRSNDIYVSKWVSGQGSAIIVPNADRAGTTEWSWKNFSCATVTSGLWQAVDEYAGRNVNNTCSTDIAAAEYVESIQAPTAANTVAFELTDPLPDVDVVSAMNVDVFAGKVGGKNATLQLTLRKADGTVIGTVSQALTTTATVYRLPITATLTRTPTIRRCP
jgi:hypothetical protein